MNRFSTIAIAALGVTAPLAAQSHDGASRSSATALIANASSAAPAAVARAATILDWPESDGEAPRTLRDGTNGWVCFPDMPETPANDPMCLDPVWQALFDAWTRQADFMPSGIGLAYMLQGGGDASLTDPFLLKPAAGGDWIISGPHVMLVAPRGALGAHLPVDAGSGGPYVMWKGTPYEHIMMPVR